MHTCVDCGKTSRSYYALYRHKQYHEDKKSFKKKNQQIRVKSVSGAGTSSKVKAETSRRSSSRNALRGTSGQSMHALRQTSGRSRYSLRGTSGNAVEDRIEMGHGEKRQQKKLFQATINFMQTRENKMKKEKVSETKPKRGKIPENRSKKSVQSPENSEDMMASNPALTMGKRTRSSRVAMLINKCVCSCGKKFFTHDKLNQHIKTTGFTSEHRVISHLYFKETSRNGFRAQARKLPALSAEINTVPMRLIPSCFVNLERF